MDSLELGYVAWQSGDNRFTLVPTWFLTGYMYSDAQTKAYAIPANMDPHMQAYGMVLVTQTGALIDPALIQMQNMYP